MEVGENGGKTMCFKIKMIEECERYLKPNQTQVRDDVIPSKIDGNTTSSEAIIRSAVNLSQMTTCMQELSTVFRNMVGKHPSVPPCDGEREDGCL